MPIKIRCSCGNVLLAPEERLGQAGKCPACDRSITVELSASETEEILLQLQAHKENENLKGQLEAKKPSIFSRLLGVIVYLFCCALIVGMYFLHTLDDKDFKVEKSTNEQKNLWDEYKEPLYQIRETQRQWCKKLLGQKPSN